MDFDAKMKKTANIILAVLAVSWTLVQLFFSFVKPVSPMTLNPLFVYFGLAIVFVNKPFPGSGKFKVLRCLDFATLPVLTWCAIYTIQNQLRIETRVPYVDKVLFLDKVLCVIVVVLLLEAIRRTIGWSLLVFVGFFVVYCFAGKMFPGFMRFSGFSFNKFVEIMTLTSNGIFGSPVSAMSSYIFYFMLFGSLFAVCGGGQVLIDIGMKFSDPKTGGPAKAAVISSGLMGMISGSAVANVSTTGVLTIPMMKKAGYEPHQAGAIEAVASTGGQIMPPIMGVAAFIMAELLGISYGKIAISAAIPAIAYYMAVFLVVDFLARKNHRAGVKVEAQEEDLVIKTAPLKKRLFLLLPAVLLVYMVMTGQSLRTAAIYSTIAILVLNIVNKNRLNLKGLFDGFVDGIIQSANVAIPVGACGVIIGAVVQSGLANKFSALIAAVGGTSLLAALLITMVGCLLLGMALPTVAAYLIATVLFVPVLVRLELPLLVCHMFCFYFGVMSQITPPVCLASFTAAGIAEADSWKTGWTGFLFALVAFIVPFVFAYEPAILLIGSLTDAIWPTFTLFLGVFALAAGVAGYMFAPLNKLTRPLVFVCAALCIVPEVITDFIAIGLLAVIIVLNRREAKKFKDCQVQAAE